MRVSAPPDDRPPRLGRAARRRGWSFDQPLLLPGPGSRLAWSILEFVTPIVFFVIAVVSSERNANGPLFDAALFLIMPLPISLASSLRSSVGPSWTVGEIGFLRRTVRTRDVAEFTTVNDVRATARLVNGRRLTLCWLHAGPYAHAWDEAPVIAQHLASTLRLAHGSPSEGRGSGRVVTLSIIRWRLAFWVGLIACSPLVHVLGMGMNEMTGWTAE